MTAGLRIDVFTIFPAMIEAVAGESVIGRGRRDGLLDIRVHDLRLATDDVHRTVDDAPFGGGAGMVMMPEPLFAAVEAVAPPRPLYYLSPAGRHLDQGFAGELAESGGFSLLCGRYEGIDERALEAISTGATRVATACPFCFIMLDDGVMAAVKEDDVIKVADLAIHVLDAIEAGEQQMEHPDAPLNAPLETPLRVPGFAGQGSTATATVDAPAPEAASDAPAEADDLKLLVGIGPALEELLNEAGISTYEALAAATLDEVQDILPDMHDGRVEREDWLGQAQAFAAAKAEGKDLTEFAAEQQSD